MLREPPSCWVAGPLPWSLVVLRSAGKMPVDPTAKMTVLGYQRWPLLFGSEVASPTASKNSLRSNGLVR